MIKTLKEKHWQVLIGLNAEKRKKVGKRERKKEKKEN